MTNFQENDAYSSFALFALKYSSLGYTTLRFVIMHSKDYALQNFYWNICWGGGGVDMINAKTCCFNIIPVSYTYSIFCYSFDKHHLVTDFTKSCMYFYYTPHTNVSVNECIRFVWSRLSRGCNPLSLEH